MEPRGKKHERTSMARYLREQKEEIVRDLESLVRAESPSNHKLLLDRCLEVMIRLFEKHCGGQIDIIPQKERGNHLRVEWGEGEEQILLLAHYDTVWEPGRLSFHIEGDKAYGPGAFDMKGGLIQGIWALKALRELGNVKKRIVFLCNSDEEIQSPTSRAFIEDEAKKSKCVLVLEPTVTGGLTTRRKGVGTFYLEIRGESAHVGSFPGVGKNAVDELARQIINLHALTDADRGTTVNVCLVEGGTRANVIPDLARASVDFRVETVKEAERVVPLILGLTPQKNGVTVKVTGGLDRPPMERTEKTVLLFEKARQAGRLIGLELSENYVMGGASDGNLTALLGVPTLDGLGPLGAGPHALDEHVVLSSIPERAALLAHLISAL